MEQVDRNTRSQGKKCSQLARNTSRERTETVALRGTLEKNNATSFIIIIIFLQSFYPYVEDRALTKPLHLTLFLARAFTSCHLFPWLQAYLEENLCDTRWFKYDRDKL